MGQTQLSQPQASRGNFNDYIWNVRLKAWISAVESCTLENSYL